MMMCSKTQANVIDKLIGTKPLELLGPMPNRKAFMFAPLAGGQPAGQLLAAVFNAGLGQHWTVPLGVTQIVDAYAWGSGGNSGAAGVAVGGGGGGGGGFASLGVKAVTPGDIYTVDVDAGGLHAHTKLVTPAAATILRANSGANGVLDIAGGGGAGTVGFQLFTGGAGASATLLANFGGGGGGAAGSNANGSTAVDQNGAAGGGGTTILSYGKGGAGGVGQNGATPAADGAAPGGGAGGKTTGAVGVKTGAAGLLVIFYYSSGVGGNISLSNRQDVVAGQGTLNWIFGQSFPLVVTDEHIGCAVGLPWWIVSSMPNVQVQITEFFYEPNP